MRTRTQTLKWLQHNYKHTKLLYLFHQIINTNILCDLILITNVIKKKKYFASILFSPLKQFEGPLREPASHFENQAVKNLTRGDYELLNSCGARCP